VFASSTHSHWTGEPEQGDSGEIQTCRLQVFKPDKIVWFRASNLGDSDELGRVV